MITFPRILAITLALAGLAMAEAAVIGFVRPPAYIAANFATEFRVRIPRQDNPRQADDQHAERPAVDDQSRVEMSAIDQSDGERVSFTERPLSGGAAPLQVFKLILPRGDLLLVATLYGANGQQLGKAQARVRVLSPYDRPEPCDDLTGDESWTGPSSIANP
jgi:hypothetical protein